MRSISAVVDVTNYVMLELGQPLHAYDDRLLDGAIVVRFARDGEKLTLLNGQVLDLEPDLLLVARREKAARARRHHGRRAFGHRRRHDERLARRRVLEPRRHPGQDRGAWALPAMPATASSAAWISAMRARGRARDAADPRHLRRARGPALRRRLGALLPRREPVRVRARARRRSSSASTIPTTDRRGFTRLGLRLHARRATISS